VEIRDPVFAQSVRAHDRWGIGHGMAAREGLVVAVGHDVPYRTGQSMKPSGSTPSTTLPIVS
jgi:hypothetical protein